MQAGQQASRRPSEQLHVADEGRVDALSILEHKDGTTELHYSPQNESLEERGPFGLSAEWWIAILTGALVASTVGLVVATALLWVSTKKAIVEAREATQLEFRPYVFRETFSVSQTLVSSAGSTVVGGFELEFVWKNVGKTPAKNLHIQINSAPYPNEAALIAADFPDARRGDTFVGSLGPGQTVNGRCALSYADVVLDYQSRVAGTAPPTRVFAWGWAEYDGLGVGERHRTEVCVVVFSRNDPTVIVQQGQPSPWADIFVTKFNSADRDCVHWPPTT